MFIIQGKALINGNPAKRNITVLESSTNTVVVRGQSVGQTGEWLVEVPDDYQGYIVIISDDYGKAMELNTEYQLGDVIIPDVWVSKRWICTTAGTTGEVEAEPWDDVLMAGSAVFTAVEIFEAEIFAPVKPKEVGAL
ncbi:hypothetical protein A134_23165 [Vibrio crassostreae 9CS106]|uniref:Uncharacterized protein n=1 Tax=Vibrio crassostreae 9CS106 TaxID=1191300 RepID=A0A1B1C3E4_9VIBR|nr:hypothetical protein A134_23165 [Vibrio crassostreae 9CS106]